jgi:hypothetical protein
MTEHHFAASSESAERQVTRSTEDESNAYQDWQSPGNAAPYHFDLAGVLGAEDVKTIEAQGTVVFHVAGDTGGVKSPEPQQIVGMWMEHDFDALSPPPAFLHHLGDVVYYNGETSEYYSQFYEPYTHYPAPILAIPGNHDGDPLPGGSEASLAGWLANFCSPTATHRPEAQDAPRTAMTLPNPYWTLTAPFVTIVGLYTNVPSHGKLQADQIEWFTNELASADPEKALIVACHHPVYSADAHHGGSAYMAGVINDAIAASNRTPDMVLTGHVHDYQRWTRTTGDRQVPYLVVGAGGYWHLHYLAKDAHGQPLQMPWTPPGSDATLESACDDRHGFLRLAVSKTTITGVYTSVPRPQESWRNGPVTAVDTFSVDLQAHTVTTTSP